MAETQNNVALLHRKEWQTMTPQITASAIGTVVVADQSGNDNIALVLNSATVHYLYHHDEDDYVPVTSGAFAGTWVAGVCGVYHPWSKTITATGGTTTTVTVSASSFNIVGVIIGKQIEFLSGTSANIGLRRTITKILNNAGSGTITITFSAAVTSSVATSDTFRISSGRFFVMSSGTLASGSFKEFDVSTMGWTTKNSATGGTTNATDARLVSPYILDVSYDSGTATSGSATTLTLTGRTWTVDQWKNYQLRITAGTGMGQVKVITSNTADTITIGSGATLDNTSQFVIEGDENAIYYIGNGAVTLYKYSISADTWSTVTVGTARAAAPAAGMSGDFVGVTGDSVWADVSNCLDGRYIYSLRGTSTVIDRYDISAQNWLATTGVNYVNPTTFNNGDSTFVNGRYLYILKEGTAAIPVRIYKYSIRGNYLEPFATDWLLGGAAVVGNKCWVKNLSTSGVIKWFYYVSGTSTIVRRIMII